MKSCLLKVNDFSYAYPGSKEYVLKHINIDISCGECHCITGPTGSGKSTLLLAIKKLMPAGKQTGEILYCPDSSSVSDIGIVLQNPETQLLGTTVGNETAFGLENLCTPSSIMKKMVEESLATIGLEFPLNFPISGLSMGQKYRLILASVLVMSPSLILLDEPGAQLDLEGIAKLKKIIVKLKEMGIGFIICEHHPDLFLDLIDAYWELNSEGELHRREYIVSERKPQFALPHPPHPSPLPQGEREFSFRHYINKNIPCTDLFQTRKPPFASEKIVEAENIACGVKEPVWSSATFDVKQGQRVGIYGDNGSGKTTLLRCISGFLPPLYGKINVFGNPPAPQKLRKNVGCLFQNPQKQLFENTVFDEVAFPLKRMGILNGQINSEVDNLLAMIGIQNLARSSPHKLSFGQKHLVALASALIFSPRLLLLDDPFAGLDQNWREKVLSVLNYISEKFNTTLIWTGHIKDELKNWADIVFCLQRGKIAASK
jgi:energy-coupling factor transport system ATP-binding protein